LKTINKKKQLVAVTEFIPICNGVGNEIAIHPATGN